MKYEISFGYFLQQMGEHPILLISVLLTLGVIFVNGWTDGEPLLWRLFVISSEYW